MGDDTQNLTLGLCGASELAAAAPGKDRRRYPQTSDKVVREVGTGARKQNEVNAIKMPAFIHR
jgi:hypothetical protein